MGRWRQDDPLSTRRGALPAVLTGMAAHPELQGVAAQLARIAHCVALVPETVLRPLFAASGLLLGRLLTGERRHLLDTLDRVYYRLGRQPGKPFNTILDEMYVHFGLTALELLLLPRLKPADLAQRFHFRGLDNVHDALSAGRGVILVVPHLGNWELLGAAIAQRGLPLHSFFLAQKEDALGAFLDYLRSFSGIVLHDRDRGASGGLRALRANGILAMIADQDGGNQGVYMDFLGHWVSMAAGPGNWSLKTGARVVPLFGLRRNRSRHFTAWFQPALPDESEGTHQDRVISRTRRLAAWMEDIILSHPEQYLWLYDRFKPRHEAYLGRRQQQGWFMRHGTSCYPL